MKKIALSVLTALLLIVFIPVSTQAGIKSKAVAVAPASAAVSAQAQVLLTRLDKINSLDKSTLSSAERKQLRKEVRSIKSQLSDVGGGVYLSIGAIILIALLLILLL